ncbi:hypothetical protein B0H66DRAFT_190913 [Apodospora peruviana]|uniref:Uncharacterized protein n=1 Tax=Apodospora peruviana TaxID=516989 RepID=A0AAE0M7B7_9PEZI|nr:hypothetical protein B0H66DRAFT_190913 [Apodospora peruviana]
MSSRPEKPEKHHKISASPKRVHFDDDYHKSPSLLSVSPLRSSHRPGSPYPKVTSLPASPSPASTYHHDHPPSDGEEPETRNHDSSFHSFPKFGSDPTFGQPIFTHYTGVPSTFQPLNVADQYQWQAPAYSTAPCYQYQENFVPQFQTYVVNPAMAYQNAGPAPTGIHFQPQVPDTTNGPQVHYYVPRHDGRGPGAQQINGAAIPLQQYPVAPQPVMQQPVMQPIMQPVMQPVMMTAGVQPSPAVPQPVFIQGQPQMMMPGNPNPVPGMHLPAGVHPEPALGVGLTAGEAAALNEQIAHDSNIDEPQDFKPADEDPSRMYRVRELDGAWTLRNRFTIDNLGDCRWYITDDGVFYAIRLPA